MHHLMEQMIAMFGAIDYNAIFWLMAMESSILPVPSELVMIPAGFNAANGSLNPFFATLAGGLGSVLGALVNYFILGKWLGKPFLEKYGKYILITPEKYAKAENLFVKNDKLYTFLGRLIPVVRHLISIPAGIFKMPIIPFIVITFLGATLWCGILVALGYYFGPSVSTAVGKYGNEIGIVAIIVIAAYIYFKIFKNSSKK